MVATINASVSSSGLVSTADGSGILKVQSNGVTTNALFWVNFNGTLTGTFSARASYNASSITRAATGDYSVAITTSLSDANYAAVGGCGRNGTGTGGYYFSIGDKTALSVSAIQCYCTNVTSGVNTIDTPYVGISIFGN